MEIRVFSDYQEMSAFAADEIVRTIKSKPHALLCFATGHTPGLAYSLFVEKAQAANLNVSNVSIVGLDEWVGVPPDQEGNCQHFFQEHLFSKLSLNEKNIHLFDALATDLQKQCDQMNSFIEERGGIDMMVVGIGLNGHIGFNEPGVPEDLRAHVIALDESTRTVGQKYFKGATLLSHGITLGFTQIMEARQVLALANGVAKAKIVAASLNSEISSAIPATLLRQHNNSIFVIDKEAASLI